MQGTPVTLEQMLAKREQRADLQRQLRAETQLPLISFCMNIPGPIKTNEQIRAAFEEGRRVLLIHLSERDIPVIRCEEMHDSTGDELVLAVRGDPTVIKDLTAGIEEAHPLGRLFDMDVLSSNGTKLSRTIYRKCLLCARQAQDCARSRRHSVEELQEAVNALLTQSQFE